MPATAEHESRQRLISTGHTILDLWRLRTRRGYGEPGWQASGPS